MNENENIKGRIIVSEILSQLVPFIYMHLYKQLTASGPTHIGGAMNSLRTTSIIEHVILHHNHVSRVHHLPEVSLSPCTR